MRKLCKSAVVHDIPLEINLLGCRSYRMYPNKSFWKIAGEEGCSAVFGFDSHTAKDAYDEASIPVAEWLAERYGLKVIDYPTLIDPKTKKRFEI